MMRTIAAILAMSPAVLYGQAQSSAQPVSTPVLQASVLQPAALVASVKSADAKGALTAAPRVSTGIVPPQIVHTAGIEPGRVMPNQGFGGDRTVVVSTTVDTTGTPVDLKVVKSADEYTDAGVLRAVSQYRFKPATLDNEAVPMTVNLAYTIH